jgi:hypothetical protein
MSTLEQLAQLLALKDEPRDSGMAQNFWELSEAARRDEATRQAMLLEESRLVESIIENSRPRIVINIHIHVGEKDGD